ncbi:MAG: cardiolipin synthase [Candidatus Omnitrophica bacterium]|nr:cardiolipin synthase [Candidatus Omnitrophota bacterium]
MGVSAYLILLFQMYLVFTVIILLLDNRTPVETFAWILIFVLMPGFGFALYLVSGRNWKKSYDRKRKLPQYIAKNLLTLFKPTDDLQAEMLKEMTKSPGLHEEDLVALLYKSSRALLTTRNKIKVFHTGQEKFDSLIADIEKAKSFIHLEYFIWRSNDPVGDRMREVLIRKVKEGVEIKILFDFSGCFFTLSQPYIKSLRKEGIQMYSFFNYLSPFKFHTINFRNHRKIVVIDGKVSYMGGMNVGQEYIDGGKKYETWRDTHFRLEGEAVNVLQAIFAIDWYNTVHTDDIFNEKYFPLIPQSPSTEGNLAVQFPTSGFDSPWPAILHLYFSVICMAHKEICIVSPYFIPEESLLMALKTAAMRGVKVTILMTGVPDNVIPFWAAFSYFDELLKAGVQIFQYQKGFLHAKMFTVDGKICSIGTTNFDIRSLRLNYEVNGVFYNKELTKQLDEQIAEDLKFSTEIKLTDLAQLSLAKRLRNSLLRLISPIL